MIYYFSACGNSEWIAKNLAKQTGDTAESIVEMNKNRIAPNEVRKGETLGLVFPVYAWSVPPIMESFIKSLSVSDGAFVYAVASCGGEAGYTFKKLEKTVKLDSAYSVLMPDVYIVMFDVDSKEETEKRIAEASVKIEKISREVLEKKKVFDVYKGKMPFIKSYVVPHIFKYMIKDKAFYAQDNCTSCGLCEKKCPVGNIKLKDGKPVWQGNCIHCMSCINRCPVTAIQYGEATVNRGRFYFDDNKR